MIARYGVPEILEADRELVESGCEEMLERAKAAICRHWLRVVSLERDLGE